VNVPVSGVEAPPLAEASENLMVSRLQTTLDAINDGMAVLNTHGTVVMANVAWQRFNLANSTHAGQATPYSEIGSNYLDVASRCTNPRGESTPAAQGIRDVLSGRMEAFCLSYPCHTSVEQHWYTMTVTPLEWEGQLGALVTHNDTTPCHRLNRR
jgi:hypothetical protein